MSQSRHDSPILGPNQPHRVLVVGGSYGGLAFIVNFLDLIEGKPCRPSHRPLPDFAGRTSQRGVEVTLLDERDGFFHTVGAPLAHTAKHHVVPFWKEYSALKELQHPALNIMRGRIEQLDCEAKRARYINPDSGETVHHEYDQVVVATGLSRQWPIVPESHSKDRYVMDALQHINTLAASRSVVVIGGGAVGIEVAAELKVNNPTITVTLIHSRARLLSNEPLPDEFKDKALDLLQEEGVHVLLNQRATVHASEAGELKRVQLTNGSVIEAGAVINATAKCPPNTSALPSEALDEDGCVRITSHLNLPAAIPNNTSHFAIGDVVAWSGIKRAGAAMFMGQIAAANVYSNILASEDVGSKNQQSEYPEYPAMMGLAVGTQAIGYGGPGTNVDFGKKTMEDLFGPDLAWTRLLKYMKLTEVRDVGEEIVEWTAQAEGTV